MIGFIIFLLLLFSFYNGARRATALQLVYTVGCILSFFLAMSVYEEWGEKIELYVPYLSVTPETEMVYYSQELSFGLDKAYYAAVAFIGWLVFGWLLTKLVLVFVRNLRFKRVLEDDWLVAGILNTVLMYITILLCLKLLTMLPIDAIQNIFTRSFTADLIVDKTPFLSNMLDKLWITNIV
ncbi:CvpA family protein [Tetragenococcus koreensis]|uniref:Colicin V production protein n=1 Tax=Tetragenococcus koreensis TaxID=290335 RepID=A0AAN4RJC5_9ENTE|nr:CvpA family protein [Tetragenococcus koreensis]AYW45420.1 colicin V production protein CvpA [Tetragenococcus koreensis]MCF1616788.1 CvpA family protein [Tetragenococcus koreensis]MCF1621724.1 CvpA family protein [Tetragenococcus koreensis]MCF1627962.1 CvpA family protein [Tetragenococcus koreensis]MCF1632855.1 CvpA family protein [Tetragenococcus koreensis]